MGVLQINYKLLQFKKNVDFSSSLLYYIYVERQKIKKGGYIMRLTSKSICNYIAVILRDFTDYSPVTCRNGGNYAFGDTLVNNFDGTFTRIPYTSGEFCPKCGSLNCCGDCEADEVISSVIALLLIKRYIDNGFFVTFSGGIIL